MNEMMVGFIDVRDRFGTLVWKLGVQVDSSMIKGTKFWSWPTEFLVSLISLLVSYGVWILDLVLYQNFIGSTLGAMYQSLLDSVYAVINPWIFASCAISVLILRIYVGEKKYERAGGRVNKKEPTKFALNFDQVVAGADESMRKQLVDQGLQVLMLMALIAFFMANPFLLVQKLIDLAQSLAFAIVSGLAGGGQDGTNAVVDGMYVPLLQMINYGDVLSPACSEQWSQAWANGRDVADLSCLTSAQESAASASAGTLLSAIVATVMVLGFFYFSVAILSKATWFQVKAMFLCALIPWRAAQMIAFPGVERERLEKAIQSFRDVAVAAAWFGGALLIGLVGPSLVMSAAGAAIDAGLPTFIALVIVAVIYGVGGRTMMRHYGKPLVRRTDGPWWKPLEFRSTSAVISWSGAVAYAGEHDKVKKALAAGDSAGRWLEERIDRTEERAEVSEEREEAPVKVSQAEAAAVDMATEKLTPDIPVTAPTVPVLIASPQRSGAELAPVGDRPGPDGEGPQQSLTTSNAASAGGGSSTTLITSTAQMNLWMHANNTANNARWVASETGPAIDGEIVEGQVIDSSGSTEAPTGRDVLSGASVEDDQSARQGGPDESQMEPLALWRSQMAALTATASGAREPTGGSRDHGGEVDAADEVLAAGLLDGGGDRVQLDEVAEEALSAYQDSVDAGVGAERGILSEDVAAAQVRMAKYIAATVGVRAAPLIVDPQPVSFDTDEQGRPVVRFGDGRGFGDDF